MSHSLKSPYQVVPDNGEWGIKLLTSSRIIEKYRTQKQAVKRAKELMYKNNRPMVVGRTRSGVFKTFVVNKEYLSNIERKW